jgi:glutamyl-tRNA synthetase
MVRTRFAPSPTGFVHVGSAYSALLNYAFAKRHKGKFIIRIEDTDQKRLVKKAEKKLYDGFKWLGIEADESAKVGGPCKPYRQSERLPIYKKYAQKLIQKGHAYYCFCSTDRLAAVRSGMQKKGLPPMYDRQCRSLDPLKAKKQAQKQKHVVRLKVPYHEKIVVNDLIRGKIIFESKVVDDQVLLKSDGFPTYHLAAVVDDHLMKISHIVRGEEWISSAPKHVLLYQFFAWQMPLLLHTPTIRDAATLKKLSKRMGHSSLDWYRENGYLPETLLNFLSLLGWSHPQEKEIFSLKEFIRYFDLKDLSPVGPIFDLKKLDWMNGLYIRQTPNKRLLALLKPFFPKGLSATLAAKTIPLVKERMKTLAEYPSLVKFLLKKLPPISDDLVPGKKSSHETKAMLTLIMDEMSQFKKGDWQAAKMEKRMLTVADNTDWKRTDFFMTFRVAITGKKISPPLFGSIEILGRQETLSRLKSAIKLLT